MDEARAALAAIPELAGYEGPLERLGGLTNRVYRAGAVCLRIPGKGTEEYISRVLPDKIRLAREYIKHSSLVFDLRLIFRTLLKLFERRPSL